MLLDGDGIAYLPGLENKINYKPNPWTILINTFLMI
jgi:hypothetical protein